MKKKTIFNILISYTLLTIHNASLAQEFIQMTNKSRTIATIQDTGEKTPHLKIVESYDFLRNKEDDFQPVLKRSSVVNCKSKKIATVLYTFFPKRDDGSYGQITYTPPEYKNKKIEINEKIKFLTPEEQSQKLSKDAGDKEPETQRRTVPLVYYPIIDFACHYAAGMDIKEAARNSQSASDANDLKALSCTLAPRQGLDLPTITRTIRFSENRLYVQYEGEWMHTSNVSPSQISFSDNLGIETIINRFTGEISISTPPPEYRTLFQGTCNLQKNVPQRF
ncbi:hypothetical protein [Vandammella animalimorsus]|uniref:hypothetical protein n=1 Tax=Vandammella animalimorsus TaxID=2029117 RepID=UPI0011789381|nr:hypothetical protein [Vandammella animalimorsus]